MTRPALRFGREIRSIARELDGHELYTRAIPTGAELDGFRWTMANHRWEVIDINGAVVQLGPDIIGDPIFYEDQLNGLFARKYGSWAQWKVVDTFLATQEIELVDGPDTLAVGDYIQFRTGGICLGDAAQLT
jgi:hypothetical protein